MAIIFGLILVGLVGIGTLYYSPTFQTFLAQKAVKYLSKELKTKIEIRAIKIVDLHTLDIEGFIIQDQNKDSLLSMGHLKVEILAFQDFDLKNHKIRLDKIQIDSTHFYLKKGFNQVLNFDFILKYFASSKSNKPSTPYSVSIHQLTLNEVHFKYWTASGTQQVPKNRINFSDIDLNHISLQLSDFILAKNAMNGKIKSFHLEEKSGFILKNMTTDLFMDEHTLRLKQLRLITPNSSLGQRIQFDFSQWSDFENFSERVNFKTNFTKSWLDTRDISYFTASLDQIHTVARFSGISSGKVNNIRIKDFWFQVEKSTSIQGDFWVKNLEDPKKVWIQTATFNIKTQRNELNSIFKEIGYPHLMSAIPKELSSIQTIEVKGSFKGELTHFATALTVKTNLGQVNSTINFVQSPNGYPSYGGNISSSEFPLGKILGEPSIGLVSFSSHIQGDGKGNNAHLDTVQTDISRFEFKGYTYHNIHLSGSQHQKSFLGKITANDPNLILGFKGLIDLNDKTPKFSFKANITKADLLKLHLTKDSISVQTRLNLSFTGSSFNDLNGHILATATNLSKGKKVFILDSILLGADKKGEIRNLYLKSCIADAFIQGKYDFKNLPNQIKEVIGRYLPSTHWNQGNILANQAFNMEIYIKDLSPITEILLPELHISSDSHIYGNFISKTQILSFNGIFPEISYGNIHFSPVILDAENVETGSLNINISSDKVALGNSVLARSINLSNNIIQDSLQFNLKVEKVDAVNHLDLNGLIAVNNTKAGLSILPSVLVLESKAWKIENSFKIGFEPGKTEIKGLEISHETESLGLNGIISSNPKDSVLAIFHKFNLATLNPILKQYDVNIGGHLNGNARVASILGTPSFSSSLKIDSLGINNQLLGNADLSNVWDGEHSDLIFHGIIANKVLKSIKLDGKIGLSSKNDGLEANLTLDHVNTALLEPLTKGIVSDFSGTISSNIEITGKRDRPILNGEINFNSLGLTVDYLNTHYKFNDRVFLENGTIGIDDFTLTDPYGKKAVVNGSVNLKNLSNPVFDIDLHAEDFLSLNTNDKQGDQYYGKAFSTGDYSFDGPLNQLAIIIDASTRPGTTLNIPLNRPNTVGKKDYITFVTVKDSLGAALKKRLNHRGIQLDFNLNITPDATVKLIFDEKIGDVIRGSGTSDLNLQLNQQGEFLMYGTYEIEKGDYLFTSQNILNKLFTIEKGGTIRFNGDPLNADIDLYADYQARADVSKLYQAANITSLNTTETSSSILVNSNIHLSGTLSDPAFNFSLKFPMAPAVGEELATYLSSKEVTTTQSMLFLISNQFNGALEVSNGTAIAASTGVQFLSNQLSNLLSNFSGRVDLNFRSLNDYGLTVRALHDRLQLAGNISNVQNQQSTFNLTTPNFNRVTGDAEASYSLTKNGSVRLKGFFRLVPLDFFQLSTIGTTNSAPVSYTQGLGLTYQKEFSSLKDLFSKKDKKQVAQNSGKDKIDVKKINQTDSIPAARKIEFRPVLN